jgi:hypothetical protein
VPEEGSSEKEKVTSSTSSNLGATEVTNRRRWNKKALVITTKVNCQHAIKTFAISYLGTSNLVDILCVLAFV